LSQDVAQFKAFTVSIAVEVCLRTCLHNASYNYKACIQECELQTMESNGSCTN